MFDVRQMPLCQTTAVRVVNALSRDGDDALVREQELLNGTVGRCVAAIRRVSFELWAV
jgi:hypothetical protein